MNHGLTPLLTYGPLALAGGVLVLLSMVHLELGPALRLARYRRWMIAAALGSGILAFLVKLLLITLIARYPELSGIPRMESKATDESAVARSQIVPRYRVLSLPAVAEGVKAEPGARAGYLWQALPGQAPAPADNPTTPEKVALGKRLFFDSTLSRDGTVSCASCHDVVGLAGADGRTTSVGIAGQAGARNAPTVWNAAFQSLLFWDGRARSLEAQALGPLLNPLEMGMPSLDEVESRVRNGNGYQAAFDRAFGKGSPITIDRITQAIAAYERTLVSNDTPYDRFVGGDLEALTPAQLRGMALFQSLGCVDCHHGPNFSAASQFDDRQPLRVFPVLPSRYEQRYPLLLDKQGRRGAWRVPSLRNVALTGPWLHNGAVDELAEVVRIMAAAQLGRAGSYLIWSQGDRALRRVDQAAPDDRQVADIVAFLHALSSDRLVAAMAAREQGAFAFTESGDGG